jgi:hypothetical protein
VTKKKRGGRGFVNSTKDLFGKKRAKIAIFSGKKN